MIGENHDENSMWPGPYAIVQSSRDSLFGVLPGGRLFIPAIIMELYVRMICVYSTVNLCK